MLPRRIVILVYEEADLLDIACPADVFDAASRWGAAPPYTVEAVSLGGRPVRTSAGLTLGARPLERTGGRIDTLIVSGGLGSERAASDARLLDEVRRLARRSRRVASVCTGAELLAAAGLLDGRRATTHWMWAGPIAARHPKVAFDPAPLYIEDGGVYTSAGVTSALDLALALVEEDHGPVMSRQVATTLVTYLQRPGNQAQVSMFLTAPPADNALVRTATGHVAAHLDGDLSAAALAAVAGVSPRHLSRLFGDCLGTTPARYVRTARAAAAARLLTSTRLPLTTVARRCGLGSAETLRQTFRDLYATSPSAYRERFKERSALAAGSPGRR